MSLVVGGGGPTGVEFAGALSELIHLVLRKDFPKLQLEEVEVHMVEAVDHVLGAFDAHLQEWAVARLRRMGVQVRLGAAVEAIDAERVRLTDGNVIEASTVVWTAGVKASGLGPSLAWSWDAVAACRLAPTLQLAGQPEVFVIGDMAQGTDPEGQPLPQLAAVAQQQGKRWRGPSAPSTKVGRPSLSGTSTRAPWRQSGATPPSSRWVGCASRASLAGSPGSRST
jgi:NADH dehydrogenase